MFELTLEDENGSSNPDDQHVEGQNDTDPEVDLEDGHAPPQPLRFVEKPHPSSFVFP